MNKTHAEYPPSPLRGEGTRVRFFVLLLVHTIVSFYYISQHNITFDEPDYVEYAKHWLQGKPERIILLDDSKSPVIALCWLPRIIRQMINPDYQLNDYGRKDQKEGRYMMIFFSFITALYVYWWCKDFYGKKGWYLPLLLLLFDPLYLAFSTIATTDIACGTFLVALLYHYRRYLISGSRKQLLLASIFTGIGIVTKQNLLFTLILLPVISITYFLTARAEITFITRRSIWHIVSFLIVVIVIINVAYYFHQSFLPFGKYTFESSTLQNLQKQLTFLHWLPVPLPHSYVQSIDMLKAHAELGGGKPESTYNGIYLFGELRFKENVWYYYLVHLWYKMPIGTMLLFMSCVPLFFKNFRLKSFSQQYLFLLIPIVFYFIILSFFNQFKIGLRHLLIVFPLLYIGLGYLLQQVFEGAIKYRIIASAAIAYSLITVAIYYPYIIPYTNEFIRDKKTVYRKIWDSSVDYGQSDSTARLFVAAHPEYKRASPVPDTGKYAVLMGEMMDTHLRNSNPYRWYQAIEPKEHLKYVLLLFDIRKEDLEKADWKKAEIRIME
jgi:hypothetical protein